MTILVAFVPRPEGHAAIEKGIELAKRNGETLIVVNAGEGGHEKDAALANAVEMERIEATIAAAGVQGEVKQFVRGNDAVEEIELMVTSRNVDLLIIGLRKRSAVGKLLLGSVAQELLMNISCPILAVKAG